MLKLEVKKTRENDLLFGCFETVRRLCNHPANICTMCPVYLRGCPAQWCHDAINTSGIDKASYRELNAWSLKYYEKYCAVYKTRQLGADSRKSVPRVVGSAQHATTPRSHGSH